MDDREPRAAHKATPPPSEAVKLEVEALRSMLGLPSEPPSRPSFRKDEASSLLSFPHPENES